LAHGPGVLGMPGRAPLFWSGDGYYFSATNKLAGPWVLSMRPVLDLKPRSSAGLFRLTGGPVIFPYDCSQGPQYDFRDHEARTGVETARLSSHLVLDQADDGRNNCTSDATAYRLAEERADVDAVAYAGHHRN
jgi:hypothetical protein